MIFIPLDHITEHSLVMLPDRKCLIRIAVLASSDSYSRRFINDHNSPSVTELIHLLRIGIMASAEGIGMKPVDQVHILHVQHRVKASAMGGKVLVLAKPLK